MKVIVRRSLRCGVTGEELELSWSEMKELVRCCHEEDWTINKVEWVLKHHDFCQ